MAGQVISSLWLLLVVQLLALVSGRGAQKAEGSVSINAHGRLTRQSEQHAHAQVRSHERSPGLDMLMEKLGLRSNAKRTENNEGSEDADDRDDGARKGRKMRVERRERERLAEEGERLEEEYYRKQKDREEQFPLRAAERHEENDEASSDDYAAHPVADEAQDPTSSDGLPYKRQGHSNVLRKRPSHAESQLEDDDDVQRSGHEQPSRDQRDQDQDSDEPVGDERISTKSAVPRERRNAVSLEEPDPDLDANNDEDDVSLEQSKSKSHPVSRREEDELEQQEYEDRRRYGSNPGTDNSRTITDPTSRDEVPDETNKQYIVGEDVRAFHRGLKQWQGGKIAATHQDGTMTINWDSGSLEYRTMNATDVYRPPIAGNPSPYRFEGPNAYNLVQEKQNRISSLSMTPSTQKNKKKIYDGFTLFPPSALSG